MRPWDFAQARKKCASAARAQQNAEETLVEVGRDYARKEEAYRKALATRILEYHANEVAWTVAPDLARGDPTVARLRRERDVAEGVREAMVHALWRHNANRRDAQRFADWSQRRELAEGTGPEPEAERTYGGRS